MPEQTQIERDTGGAAIPDVTLKFDELISAALMVPMGLKGPLDPDCAMGLPCLFWGLSGIAKSDKIRQGALRVGLPTRIIFPGQKQPEEFGDVPVVMDPDGTGQKLLSACMLSQVNELNRLIADKKNPVKGGVLFIDEVSCATPATQAALLGLVLDRAVGATQIHPTIRILLAANPPSAAAGGWGLEPPLANRMAHFYVRCPPVRDWANWLMVEHSDRFEPIEGAMQKLRANWAPNWAAIRGLLISFMDSHQTLLHNQPTSDHPQAGYSWSSPRTWWMAGRAIATVRSMGMSPELEQYFVEACVGLGPAQEWLSWLANVDLPSPQEVLTKGWAIDRNRLDKVMAVYSSMTAYVLGIPTEKEKLEVAALAWTRLDDLVQAGLKDIAVRFAQLLSKENCGFANKHAPEALKTASKPVLQAVASSKSGVADYIDD
jgi:hypothetical protein